MKVLFVYRGYGDDQSNAVIDYQRESLRNYGWIEISSFIIKQGGYKSYTKSIFSLHEFLKSHPFDIIHAHYSLCGFISRLATSRPVVCSLMGSDVLEQGGFFRILCKAFHEYFWNATIVKSQGMHKMLQKSYIIPNGVDLSHFRVIQRQESIKIKGFNSDFKNIIFVAQDPGSRVKNHSLAKLSCDLINEYKVRLHVICGKPIEVLPYYFNAADLLLLCSFSEGSPNVIKEAMACNCPIVATDVGDIREVIGDTEGCYITSFDPKDVAEKIKLALAFGKRTNGREKIGHLDNRVISKQIVDVYKSVLNLE